MQRLNHIPENPARFTPTTKKDIIKKVIELERNYNLTGKVYSEGNPDN